MYYDELAISVEGISKIFEVYDKPVDRLKKSIVTRLPTKKHYAKKYYSEYHALSDISFNVAKGETVGILGHNGAGKSTLLQVVCNTLAPSQGEVKVNGRIAALLELGAGFNPEFTGRENVFMGAAIAGLSSNEVEEKYDEILAFADIGEHIEQPVKTYSSGMYVRLAFAVSIILTPDILIVDEALSVGDIYFQKKCRDKLKEFQKGGGTLLLVTHSTQTVVEMCDRCVVLESGNLIFDGDTEDAVAAYIKAIFGSHNNTLSVGNNTSVDPTTSDSGIKFKEYEKHPSYNKGEIRLGDGRAIIQAIHFKEKEQIQAYTGDRVHIDLQYVMGESLNNVLMGMALQNESGIELFAMNSYKNTGALFHYQKGDVVNSEIEFDLPLMPGNYFITFGVSQFVDDFSEIIALDRRVNSMVLSVMAKNIIGEGIIDVNAKLNVNS